MWWIINLKPIDSFPCIVILMDRKCQKVVKVLAVFVIQTHISPTHFVSFHQDVNPLVFENQRIGILIGLIPKFQLIVFANCNFNFFNQGLHWRLYTIKSLFNCTIVNFLPQNGILIGRRCEKVLSEVVIYRYLNSQFSKATVLNSSI